MLSGNCTEALSIQANVTISFPAQNSLKRALPLSRSLPALLKQYGYIKRGERGFRFEQTTLLSPALSSLGGRRGRPQIVTPGAYFNGTGDRVRGHAQFY